jgi:hypothetical protein
MKLGWSSRDDVPGLNPGVALSPAAMQQLLKALDARVGVRVDQWLLATSDSGTDRFDVPVRLGTSPWMESIDTLVHYRPVEVFGSADVTVVESAPTRMVSLLVRFEHTAGSGEIPPETWCVRALTERTLKYYSQFLDPSRKPDASSSGYRFRVPAGEYEVCPVHDGSIFAPEFDAVRVQALEDSTVVIRWPSTSARGTIEVVVEDDSGLPIDDCMVSIWTRRTAVTRQLRDRTPDSFDLICGNYRLDCLAFGYEPSETIEVKCEEGSTRRVRFILRPHPSF